VETDAALKADPRAGSTVVAPLADGGKEARTRFTRLSVAPDNQTSVVQCEPLTGRTHQVRTELGLGHARECPVSTLQRPQSAQVCVASSGADVVFQI
jgi:23S rRNA-/tRNA-specific pseudouridylate synthase